MGLARDGDLWEEELPVVAGECEGRGGDEEGIFGWRSGTGGRFRGDIGVQKRS